MLPVGSHQLSDSHFICLFGVSERNHGSRGLGTPVKDILDQTFKIARDAQWRRFAANPGRDVGFTFGP